MASINVGDTQRLFITFYDKPADDPTRAAGDPADVTLRVKKPDDTIAEYTGAELTHTPGSGLYEYVIVVDQAGWWRWRWEGTGGVLTSEAEQGTFYAIRENPRPDDA